MCTIKIAHLQDSYGQIVTTLSQEHKRRELRQLNADDLAQLIIDLRTIPQPHLRRMEVDNLVALIGSYGRQREARFGRVLARQFGRAMLDVSRFDDACREAEARLSLARERVRPYTVFVAPSSQV